MFKLCGMEDAKLISMVQLNGGILLMPESVSTYQLLMLVDALNRAGVRVSGGGRRRMRSGRGQNTGTMTLDEVLREFTVAVPDWAREQAGITENAKLECLRLSEDAGVSSRSIRHRTGMT